LNFNLIADLDCLRPWYIWRDTHRQISDLPVWAASGLNLALKRDIGGAPQRQYAADFAQVALIELLGLRSRIAAQAHADVLRDTFHAVERIARQAVLCQQPDSEACHDQGHNEATGGTGQTKKRTALATPTLHTEADSIPGLPDFQRAGLDTAHHHSSFQHRKQFSRVLRIVLRTVLSALARGEPINAIV
jgi:hypothetical protein